MWLDLTILARTPAVVWRREGITAMGSSSAPVLTRGLAGPRSSGVQPADVI
jgi:hypothetical protein